MNRQVMLLYPRTNKHLGLWDDLAKDNRVLLRCTDKRFSSRQFSYLYQLISIFCRHKKTFPFHNTWFQYYDLFKVIKKIDHLILIDGALNVVEIPELEKCKKINPDLKISLYLINSIRAKSPILNKVRPQINKIKWDNIFTFDEKDATDFGYTYLGFNYYSKHEMKSSNSSIESDVYFVGGLKGGRQDLINETFNSLKNAGLVCNFDIMLTNTCNKEILIGVNYYRGWRPYQDILSSVFNTNCIIEIVQEGQCGATLRYFEAVCMNKKLISNNPNITKFPFYNPKWMRVFNAPGDIDIDWIKRVDYIDYGYNGEFSPVHLIDYLLMLR